MEKFQSKRFFRIVLGLILIVSLILPAGMATNVAQAAAKPSIPATKEIGTGSIVGAYDYYSKDNKYELSVSNAVKNATYSFVSSNTQILTVKASGSKAYLTGIKAGTATITCNQKLQGKTAKVGTCKVTVANSTISQDYTPELPLGSGNLEVLEFANRNNDATYTYVSDNKNFTMKENISTFDDMLFIHQTYTAAAAGTYTVTVKETYNKATRVVGKIKYTVKKAAVESEETVALGSSIEAYDLISNCRTDVNYLFETGDSDIVQTSVEDDTINIIGKKAGTTEINIYENAKTPDKSKLIGTCKITVKEISLKSIDCNFEETEAYVSDEPISVEVTKEPSEASGTITVTSSNPKVATVSDIDEDGFFEVTPVSAGTTTSTVACGDVTKTQIFTVNEDED
ncbi:MAG TPA: hypothetical protein VHP38_16730 [Ruminiclostridium sp.]|nr:hypothetical protein [Ruminiclostridium sp.]